MTGRGPALLLAGVLAAAAAVSVVAYGAHDRYPTVVDERGHRRTYAGPALIRFDGAGPERWAHRYRRAAQELVEVRRQLRRRWAPTVQYALELASRVSGVPYGDLSRVAWCESRLDPFARNGRYVGLLQLGWAPFGMDPYDPIANALSAALTVRRDGSWRQWTCKP